MKGLPSWSLFQDLFLTQWRGILQGIKMQEAYANGICWFTAWTDLGRFFKVMARGTAFPYRHALARCQVSASKYRIMRDLVKSWLPENFYRKISLLGDILAEVVTVWQKPYTDENIISQHIAKGLCNRIYSKWYLTPLIKSQFLWNSRPWEKLKETDPFLQLETLNPGRALKQGRSDSVGRSSDLLLCSVPREPRASNTYIHSHLDAWVVVVIGQHAWWPHS